MISIFSSTTITYIIALLRIAFFTLLERKILGYAQLRKGPNKPSIIGLPQPLADAIKLIIKEQSSPLISNHLAFIIVPGLRLFLALILWSIYPSNAPSLFISYSLLLFLCISRLRVYTTIGAGWTSNSKYSLLGALRRVAQTISYEVRIALILIRILLFHQSFNTQEIFTNSSFYLIFISPILIGIWIVTTVAETNRAPFDFAEGERELVSGFNTEYTRNLFAAIFIAEYLNILIMSFLTALLSLSHHWTPFLAISLLAFKTRVLSILFLYSRAALPRLRYDQLINLTWSTFLPIRLTFIIIYLTLV